MATLCPTGGVSRGAGRGRLLNVARWGLALVFAWSAGGKFFWPTELREILWSTGMIPRDIIPLMAYALPTLEALLALALATRFLFVPALFVSVFLSVVFVAVHAYLLVAGEVVPCGCSGVAISFESAWFHAAFLALSVLMALASLLVLFATPPRRHPASPTG